tara:strand:+ start:270 stop:584 length:315 start_codon:yes stop_codon:yes gene_type:complete
MQNVNLESLEIALKNHDWTYQMSDDGSVFQRGIKQTKEIEKIITAKYQEAGGYAKGREVYKKIEELFYKYYSKYEAGVTDEFNYGLIAVPGFIFWKLRKQKMVK